MRVAEKYLDEVRTRGFTVVPGFIGGDELKAAQDALWLHYPRPEEYFAHPGKYEQYSRSQFSGLLLFPYRSWALNHLAFHPDLVDAAERLLGTDDLHLYKVELWAKYSGAINYDQAHHFDYGNHTLVVPRRDRTALQMTTFLLLSDVTELDGPTKMIPRQESSDIGFVPNQMTVGELNEVEVPATGEAGSLLIYSTDVLHRGSNFKAAGRSRFVLLADYMARGAPWMGKMAWPNRANDPNWAPTMARASLRERGLFGFPAPGDDYWCEQTVRDVGLRYPEMDMEPYRTAMR